jgi:predicted secreted protein
MNSRILFGMFLCLAACSAPQGKKIGAVASNGGAVNGLAPVASGPGGATAESIATIPTTTESILNYNSIRAQPGGHQEIVGLHTGKTLTVKLPAMNLNGYEWRMSEIPDPTVLKLVSKEYTPGPAPGKAGEQTMVFEGVGPGDVNVKMWYGTLWASSFEAPTAKFIASVSPEPAKPSAKSSKKSKKANP